MHSMMAHGTAMGSAARPSGADPICIRAETFEHMLLNVSIRWQIQKVMDFLGGIKTGDTYTITKEQLVGFLDALDGLVQ